MAHTPTLDKERDSATETLLPPEEQFWQRYSPHHELPLSGVGSFVLHGLVIGILILAYVLLNQQRESESNRPVTMDVVKIEGDGTGFEGGGGGGQPGTKGQLNKDGRTEDVFGQSKASTDKIEPPEASPKFEKVPDVPIVNPPETADTGVPEIDDSIRQIAREADSAVKKAMNIASTGGNPDGGKTVGKGGTGGVGDGPGKGNKTGPGVGQGGPGGGKATRAEIFAARWRFELGGNPREHATKLDVVGVILAVPDPRGEFFLIRDFKRRPAELRRENLEPFRDAVKWYNVTPASLAGLARELRLPFTPRYVVMLLPRDREQLMADAEQAYAERNGRSLKTVRETSFDFQLRDGAFQPVVIQQK